jgi:hypothetical protein
MDGRVRITDKHVLRKLLSRLPKEHLLALLERWKMPLSITDASSELTSRGQLAQMALKHDRVSSGLTLDQTAEADLRAVQAGVVNKTWTAIRFERGPNKPSSIVSGEELRAALSPQLDIYFRNHLLVVGYEGALWFRVAIHEQASLTELPPPGSTIYGLFHPHSDFVVLTRLRSVVAKSFSNVLRDASSARSVTPLNIENRSAAALCEVLLNQDSQGPFRKYRLNQVDANPLEEDSTKALLAKRPRSASTSEPGIREDTKSLEKRRRDADDTFGSGPQPALQTVEFDITAPFGGGARVEEPVRMKVTLAGSNVLQALPQLMRTGLLQAPLPDFLSRLPSAGVSKLTLRLGQNGEELPEAEPEQDDA